MIIPREEERGKKKPDRWPLNGGNFSFVGSSLDDLVIPCDLLLLLPIDICIHVDVLFQFVFSKEREGERKQFAKLQLESRLARCSEFEVESSSLEPSSWDARNEEQKTHKMRGPLTQPRVVCIQSARLRLA